jgi:hypothetical protein
MDDASVKRNLPSVRTGKADPTPFSGIRIELAIPPGKYRFEKKAVETDCARLGT